MTRSAPAPLDTLSDAESARGQKKSPLPLWGIPRGESERAGIELSETEPSVRLFARHRVPGGFPSSNRRSAVRDRLFTFCSLRLSSRVSRFSKLSTSISFSSFHRVGEICNFNFFEPIEYCSEGFFFERFLKNVKKFWICGLVFSFDFNFIWFVEFFNFKFYNSEI